MFSLRACFLMGWVRSCGVSSETGLVELTLSNGRTLTYTPSQFNRQYRA